MLNDHVHIVMATYNGEKFLRQQLDSLLSQTYRNISIEVCDDGSTDQTLDILKEYEENCEVLTVHRNEQNLGYVMNFLQGIKRSEEGYIMLCDQDDVWNDDKIEKTLQEMKKQEEQYEGKPVLVYTDAMNFDSDSNENLGSFHQSSHLDTAMVDTAHLFMENKIIGCTVMVNRYVIPYLDELPTDIRVHDWWLALICSHFGTVAYLPEMTLRYRQHSGNMIGGSSFSDYIKNRLKGIREQKEVLRATVRQGQQFEKLFGGQMSKTQKEIAEAFGSLYNKNGFARRRLLFKYGFWKSGTTRNVGLLLLI